MNAAPLLSEIGRRQHESGLWAGFLCCCLFLSLGASVRAQQIPLRSYTTADGLVHDEILRIVRDSRGFLWFGTSDGLSRFDSHTFTNYTVAHGLPHRSVRDILETRRGDYWIATAAGLCRLNISGEEPRSRCTVYKPGDSEAAQNVFRLFEDRAGVIWVGTFGGVYRLETVDGQVTLRFADFGMPAKGDDRLVQDFLEDTRGSLWVATRGSGLYRRWPDGRIDHYAGGHGLPARINSLAEDADGTLLAGTSAAGVLRLAIDAPEQALRIEESITFPALSGDVGSDTSNWVTRLFRTVDGTLWVATPRGIATRATNARHLPFETYTTTNGLTGREISALAEDPDGNVWLGTPDRGAMKMVRNGFITFGKTDGLGIPAIGSIFEDPAGNLFLFANGIVSRFSGTRFDSIRPNFPRALTDFSWARDQIALLDHSGEWWFASTRGLCRFPRVRRAEDLAEVRPRAVYTRRDGLPGDLTYNVFEDKRDDIWITSFSEDRIHLTRWERATARFIEQTDTQGWSVDTWVNAFVEDAAGNVWLATDRKGLARYRDGSFQFLTIADGLRSNDINGLYVDPSGRLWIALRQGGVDMLDGLADVRPRVTNYGLVSGLASDETLAVTGDLAGNIYLTSGKGVDRLDPATGRVEHFTTADGLARGAGGGFAFRDRHGALWFGSNNELSRYVPGMAPAEPAPPVFIGAVRVAGEERPVPMLGAAELPTLLLQPSQNHIAIEFFGLLFRAGETLRYQYRLDGADRDWSSPTEQRTVNYASLSPGDYRFLVRALGADDAPSLAPASVAFTILPPFWRRWWFLALGTLAVAAAIAAFHRYRVSRLIELHRTRMRIATDLHDDIGASLSRVAILSEVAKRQIATHPAESASILGDIADSARTVVDSMRDIVWTIDPRHDTVDDLLSRVRQFASSVLEARGIRWDLQVPPDIGRVTLDPEQRRQVLLFFKEAVHNIVRHSECRAASATVELRDGLLVSRIRDDGKGLPSEVLDPSSPRRGVGLVSLRERALQAGGQLTVESLSQGGTQLTFTVPLSGR